MIRSASISERVVSFDFSRLVQAPCNALTRGVRNDAPIRNAVIIARTEGTRLNSAGPLLRLLEISVAGTDSTHIRAVRGDWRREEISLPYVNPKREEDQSQSVVYFLYLYLLGLSLKNLSLALDPFVNSYHVVLEPVNPLHRGSISLQKPERP